MSVHEQSTLPFDVLSYPRGVTIEGVVLDVTTGANRTESGDSIYVDRQTVCGEASEAAAQYISLATESGYSSDRCMVISDRPDVAEATLQSGMGVTLVDNAEGADTALNLLLDPRSNTQEPLYKHSLYTDLSYREVAESLYKPGEITIVGFVGRTGAGKSTTIKRLVGSLQETGGYGGLFEVDSFFVRSRADRKAWLNEPGISSDERADRRRVITWWNLGRATNTLTRIRSGEHVYIDGLYDMQQGGEMVGTLDINPGNKGYTVFVEGTALLDASFDNVIDSFVYLNTHDEVRSQLLMERNSRDGYTADESRARKVLTDAAETGEHIARGLRTARFIRGNLTVLDNTNRSEQLRLMPPYIPRK